MSSSLNRFSSSDSEYELVKLPSFKGGAKEVDSIDPWQSVASHLIDGRYLSVLRDSKVSVGVDYGIRSGRNRFSLDEIVQAVVSAARRVRVSQKIPGIQREVGVYLAERVSLLYQEADTLCAEASAWVRYQRKIVEMPYLVSGYPPALLQQASLDFRSYSLEEFKFPIDQIKGHASLCDALCPGGGEHTVQKGAILIGAERSSVSDFLPPHIRTH